MFPLPPASQALYHGGCSAKHAGKALLALWQCRRARLVILATVAGLALLLLPGCATAGGGSSWNPLTWVFGRQAAKEVKVEGKVIVLEDAQVDAAQVEVVKTGLALAAAPASRPVEVAKRTNSNAAALLNQRKPLNAATLADIQATVAGLLSEEVAKREAAERAQSETEKRNQGMAQELEDLRTELKGIKADRVAEAANNLAVANQLRAATIWKWTATAGSVIFAVGMMAYRANAFGLATRVAGGLVDIERQHGAGTADLARGALDSALDMGDKNKIFSALKVLAPDIAKRVS